MRYAECIECGKKEPRTAGVLIGTRCWDCRQEQKRRSNLTGKCAKCGKQCTRNAVCCMMCRGNHNKGGGKPRWRSDAGKVKPETQSAAEAERARRVIDRDAVLAALMKGKR